MRIEDKLSNEEILKFTEGRPVEELSQHELGDIGETITKAAIIPRVKRVSKVQQLGQLGLQGVSGVPFDVIAMYNGEIWLIETKTGKSRFENAPKIQKKRMKKLLELLAQRKVEARPILVQIKLETGDYRIRDFSIEYKDKGMASTFPEIVEKILDYQKDRK